MCNKKGYNGNEYLLCIALKRFGGVIVHTIGSTDSSCSEIYVSI